MGQNFDFNNLVMYYSFPSQTLVRAHKLFTEQLHPNHMLGTLNAPISSTYTPLIQMEGNEILLYQYVFLYLAAPPKIAHWNKFFQLLHDVATVLLERG